MSDNRRKGHRTEAEKARLLEELAKQDPDRQPLDLTIHCPESYYREILGVLFSNVEIAEKYLGKITHEHFPSEVHKHFMRGLTQHWERFGKLPSQAYLEKYFSDALSEKEEAYRLYSLGELHEITTYLDDHAVPEEIDFFLTDFLTEQQTKCDWQRYFEACKQPKITAEERTEIIRTTLENRERNKAGNLKAELCDLDTFFSETDSEYRYLVPKRIPQGKLGVLAGPAKKGKTTCLIQSFIDLLYCGTFMGEQAEPFPFYYLDYENDTAYLKHCILNPAMENRDWTELKKWFRVSNRQVESKARKLPPYISPEFLDKLAKNLDQPGFFLIDSLRRSFGRKPGLKANWEWDAGQMSALLDPFSEWCHKPGGHSVAFIHHHNHDGRASGSTDILAVPDVLYDFEVVKAPGTGLETNQRRFKISGRISPSPPHLLDFEDGVYRYLGSGSEATERLANENIANTMAAVVRHLETDGPASGTALYDKKLAGKRIIFDAIHQLEAGRVVAHDKSAKKYGLLPDYKPCWSEMVKKYGIVEPGV